MFDFFTCPITHERPRIIAVTEHGQAYDFFALANNILNAGSLIDPMARLEIESINLLNGCEEGSLSNKLKKAIARTCLNLEEKYPLIKINGVSNLSGVMSYIDRFTPEQPQLLYRIIKEGNLNRLMRMIDKGMDINSTAATGIETPLYIACFYGHLAIVQWLLEQPNILVNKGKTERNITPLYVAAARGRLDIVTALLNQSATNLNQATALKSRLTALGVAAEEGYVEIVKALLDDSRLNFTQTIQAFRIAEKNEKSMVVSLMLEYYCLKLTHIPLDVNSLFQMVPETLDMLRQYKDELWDLLKKVNKSPANITDHHEFVTPHPIRRHPSLCSERRGELHEFYHLLNRINESAGQSEEEQHPFFRVFKGNKRRTFFNVNIMGQIQLMLREFELDQAGASLQRIDMCRASSI